MQYHFPMSQRAIPPVQTKVSSLRLSREYETKAKVLKSLAHPTRLFLVDVLSHGEQNVRDLTEMVGVDISTVSKHLSILKRSGLVQHERRGLQVFYSLRIPCALDFFNCLDSVELEDHLSSR